MRRDADAEQFVTITCVECKAIDVVMKAAIAIHEPAGALCFHLREQRGDDVHGRTREQQTVLEAIETMRVDHVRFEAEELCGDAQRRPSMDANVLYLSRNREAKVPGPQHWLLQRRRNISHAAAQRRCVDV